MFLSMRPARSIAVIPFVLIVLSGMTSCTTTRVRHVRPDFVSGVGRDSVNRLARSGSAVITTRSDEFFRDPGFLHVRNDTVEIRSRILFDTLRIPIDSVRSLRFIEDLPLGTVLMATIGGAGAGYAVGRAAGESWNAEFPVGLALIGGGSGGLWAFLSSKETLFLIDPGAPLPEPAPTPPAPPKRKR
ncbi:MAG: hypothetical protein ACKO9V_00325 [Candidatus Kapaibacterium sp.]